MEPQIQYVRSADGTNIAYTDMGEGVPMIFTPNIWAARLTPTGETLEASQRLVAERIQLARYDLRGFGMSDRNVEDFSLERQVDDLEALREHLGFDQFVLWGNIHGCPASIAYAVAYPERITHLILSNPFANGDEWYRAWPMLKGLESFRAMGDEQWDLYTFTHATTISALHPGSDAQLIADLMRECTTPDALRRYYLSLRTQDVSPLLHDIATPTLLFLRRYRYVARGESLVRAVAARIPRARLVTVRAHSEALSLEEARHAAEFILGRPVDWPSSIAPAHPQRVEGPGTAVILFADIADSTALTERLGDAAFRAKARELDGTLRAAIRERGGTPVEGKLLGDGVLAVFTSAREAIGAALACGEAGAGEGLPLHLGIHAGDVIRERDPDGRDNVYGGAVNIASRIAGLSAAGEVLVSETVRSLARPPGGVGFEDRGEQELKGVGEAMRVWAVRQEPRSENPEPAGT
jgi:class 3 adenylate cyclase